MTYWSQKEHRFLPVKDTDTDPDIPTFQINTGAPGYRTSVEFAYLEFGYPHGASANESRSVKIHQPSVSGIRI